MRSMALRRCGAGSLLRHAGRAKRSYIGGQLVRVATKLRSQVGCDGKGWPQLAKLGGSLSRFIEVPGLLLNHHDIRQSVPGLTLMIGSESRFGLVGAARKPVRVAEDTEIPRRIVWAQRYRLFDLANALGSITGTAEHEGAENK